MPRRPLSLTKDHLFFSLYSIQFFRHEDYNGLTIELFVRGICSMLISEFFDRLNQIILNLFIHKRILSVQRMISNELPYPHGIRQDLTWGRKNKIISKRKRLKRNLEHVERWIEENDWIVGVSPEKCLRNNPSRFQLDELNQENLPKQMIIKIDNLLVPLLRQMILPSHWWSHRCSFLWSFSLLRVEKKKRRFVSGNATCSLSEDCFFVELD